MKTHKKLKRLMLIGFVALLLTSLVSCAGNADNNGKTKEADLTYQYKVNFAYLSNCLANGSAAAGVASANAAATDKILMDAVTGRYQGNSSAKPGDGQMFSAIKEAYPDISGVNNSYQKVMDVIIGCRTDYLGQQVQLADKLRSFDKWRHSTRIARKYANKYPDVDLIVDMPDGTTLTGPAAEKKMGQLIVTAAAAKAQTTGTIPDNNDPFATTTVPHG